MSSVKIYYSVPGRSAREQSRSVDVAYHSWSSHPANIRLSTIVALRQKQQQWVKPVFDEHLKLLKHRNSRIFSWDSDAVVVLKKAGVFLKGRASPAGFGHWERRTSQCQDASGLRA